MTTLYTRTDNADGSVLWAPQASPPPTGGFTFRPAPAGWKAVLQQDLTAPGASLAFESDFAYGGRPGGASGCIWTAAQLTFVPGKGARIETKWNGTEWISAGFGTTAKFSFPLRVRWYSLLASANIDGHNMVDLLWCNPWIEEVDRTERAISGGKWQPSISRIHNGSSATVAPPIVETVAPALNVVYCNEAELAPVKGTPTLTALVDGVVVGAPAVIPAADWQTFLSNPHWVGTQDELYSIGTASKTAVDERYVLGIEVFQPA